MDYAHMAAMTWSYFAIVMIFVGIVAVIVNKYIFYEND